jgi:hypothetical protein
MTPEERDLLNQSIKIAEENNKILRSMRRGARFSSFLKMIWWVVILGLFISSYYLVKPYLEVIMKGYGEIQKGLETVNAVGDKMPTIPELPSWLSGKK